MNISSSSTDRLEEFVSDTDHLLQIRMRGPFIWVQLIVSSVLVVVQLAIIPVMVIYADLRRRILYRIMLSISLSDFLQLYAIWQFTLFEAIGYMDWPNWLEKFASAVYIVAWDHLITQHFLLALNRFLIILRAYSSNKSNNGESRAEHWFFNSSVVISWLLLLALTIAFMTPYCSGVWDRVAVGFFYDERLKCSIVYGQAELYFTIVFPALSVVFYLIIVILLKKTRRNAVVVTTVEQQNAAISQQNQQQTSTQLLSVQEKRILLLSVLLFTIITALIFSWYYDYRNPPWTILFCGYLTVNTSLNLIMNSEYRHRFFQMLRRGRLRTVSLLSCRPKSVQRSRTTEVMSRSLGGGKKPKVGGGMRPSVAATQLHKQSAATSSLFVRRTAPIGNAPTKVATIQ